MLQFLTNWSLIEHNCLTFYSKKDSHIDKVMSHLSLIMSHIRSRILNETFLPPDVFVINFLDYLEKTINHQVAHDKSGGACRGQDDKTTRKAGRVVKVQFSTGLSSESFYKTQ